MATEYPPYQPIQASSWKVAEAKFLFDIVLGKMLQPEPRNPADQLVPYLRAANVQWSGISLSDVATMYASEGEIQSCSIVQGDLLVCEGGEVGRAAIYSGGLPDEAIIQNALHRVRSKNGNSTRYLCYVLRHIAWSGWFDVLCNKATIAHFTVDKFGELQIAYPEPQVQELIADFLDSETTRLDTLISEKQRLLNLLADKRRAIIADFLTKGLNKDAPRRDSDVPWLGEIPAHWQVERAKWLFTERDDRSDSGDEELLTVSHLTGVTSRAEKDVNMFMAESLEGYKRCQAGDLVINTLWAWMGAMGVARQPGIVSPAYNVYQPVAELDPEYVDLLVRTPRFVEEITRYSKGVWSSRLRLYPEGLYEAWLPVPPLDEQRAIVKHVQIETQKLDALASATERTITLLQERRSALISAAVTGQLDAGEMAA
ncbi:restriction endonuclease subunit S [Aquitalea sp. LB_tupeE]|uniref:restriction endonuclease subunit S n=1 Tax=Aquitalea sp. LB_tupeE TaxID=2748078 RepID=UPI0015BC5FB3|nr:restriction endonuclease subunit S [Aquitalea sp. LB_tupeE]NWK76917.1 restriction endonuclease subunit S [Aquitalea sp. LB_tupeE]